MLKDGFGKVDARATSSLDANQTPTMIMDVHVSAAEIIGINISDELSEVRAAAWGGHCRKASFPDLC